MNQKNKAIVTGGLGFIGSNLVEELLAQGWEVHVVDNCANSIPENLIPGASLKILDIRKGEELTQYFGEVKPDAVFHLAALPRVQFSIENPELTNNVNINGTLNVLIAAHKAGAKKVVYASSSSVYGDQRVMPLAEGMTLNPKSPYGAQKLMGEIYCRVWDKVYNLPTISLRFFNVYGPRQNAEGAYALVIAKFLKQKKEGVPLTITGDGEQTRDFTHVSDIVRGCILAAQSDVRGIEINLGAGNDVSVNKIAKMIGGPVEYVEARIEPKNTKAANFLAAVKLRWVPKINIKEGISQLVKAQKGLI